MTEQRQRYWPSLFDRLLSGDEDAPADDHFVTFDLLQRNIERDLLRLLNHTALGSITDLSRHPRVARSVLNYGVPDLPGRIISGISASELTRALDQALIDFEPRIAPGTVTVRIEDDNMPDNPYAQVKSEPGGGVSLMIRGAVHGLTQEALQLRIATHIDPTDRKAEIEVS